MASEPPVPIQSLARESGAEIDGAMTFEEALMFTSSLVPQVQSKPIITNRPSGLVKVGDLPLQFLNVATSGLRYWCDIIHDWSGPCDTSPLGTLLSQSRYAELPEPFGAKQDPLFPYTMQLVVLDQDDGKKTILKHIFTEGIKVAADQVQRMCFGLAMQINYGKNFRDGGRGFNYLLDQLGGWQARYVKLVPNLKGSAKVSKDVESIKAGYDYLRKCGPRGNNSLEQSEWAEIQVVTEGSPLYGWSAAAVESRLRTLSAASSTARTVEMFPLTLKDVAGWFLDDVLYKILPCLLTSSVIFLGKPGRGKSPVMRILCFLFSKYWIQEDGRDDLKPSMRVANKLDYFRGEPGSKYKPLAFDDGLLHKQGMDDLKAYHDMTDEDAQAWARWGGSKFEMNQLRVSGANPIDENAETHPKCSTGAMMSHECFLKLIKPSIHPDASDDDVMAVLKRASVVVATDAWIYVRLHGAEPCDVPRFMYPGQQEHEKVFLASECKAVYQAYKKGSRDTPGNYDEDMAWSLTALRMLLHTGKVPPRTWRIVCPRLLFSDGSLKLEVKPKLSSIASDAISTMSSGSRAVRDTATHPDGKSEESKSGHCAEHERVRIKQEVGTLDAQALSLKRSRSWASTMSTLRPSGSVIDLEDDVDIILDRESLFDLDE